MIPLEGKMLSGLDEFMLRLGHLKVLCQVAMDVGGSSFRINREAAQRLTAPVRIPESMKMAVAEYLHRKHLCAETETAGEERSGKDHYRYPDLVLHREGETERLRICAHAAKEPEIWWQDLCLAGSGVRSRVGGITITGKSGSKTGLSHLLDWAQFTDLISPAGDVSAMGRILRLARKNEQLAGDDNPYVLGSEKLPLAFCLLGADIDLFSRFVPKLHSAKAPIRKAEAAQLFAAALEDVVQEARNARYLSEGRKGKLYENYRDLERPAKRSRRGLGETSTAWHRASSRLETYVDVGLLEKGLNGEEERYEYTYYPSANLEMAVLTLGKAKDGREWIERYLSGVIFAVENSDVELPTEELPALLSKAASYLARPAAPLPIDALAVGSACLQADWSTPVSIGAYRRGIEALARQNPDIARLSRGGYGDRAEFVSLNLRTLEEQASHETGSK